MEPTKRVGPAVGIMPYTGDWNYFFVSAESSDFILGEQALSELRWCSSIDLERVGLVLFMIDLSAGELAVASEPFLGKSRPINSCTC